jgi:hypothetical protein
MCACAFVGGWVGGKAGAEGNCRSLQFALQKWGLECNPSEQPQQQHGDKREAVTGRRRVRVWHTTSECRRPLPPPATPT